MNRNSIITTTIAQARMVAMQAGMIFAICVAGAATNDAVDAKVDVKPSDVMETTNQLSNPVAIKDADAFTNDSIVKLVKAGMSDEIVLNVLKTQPAKLDLSVDAILTLKSQGVSDSVINAMILHKQPPIVAAATAVTNSLKIQSKTPVRLIIDETLSSGNSKAGDAFRLVVAEDVLVGGNVVIAKGAPATGRITGVRQKSFPNSNGKIEIAVDSVLSVDGQNITVEGRVSEDLGGTSIGRTGRDAKLEKGYQITAVVDGEKEVDVNKASKPVSAPVSAMDGTPAKNVVNKINDPMVERLRFSLKSKDPEVLVNALQRLRFTGASEVVPDILILLKDTNPSVLCAACQTLAVLGNKEAIPSIEPLLAITASSIIRDDPMFLRVFSVASWVKSSPVEVVKKEAQAAIATLRSKP